MKFISYVKSINKKTRIGIIVFASCLIAFVILTLICAKRVNEFGEQHIADQWNPQGNGGQVTIFLSEDVKADINVFYRLNQLVSDDYALSNPAAFTAQSDEMFPGPFTSAYSAEGTVTISTDDGNNFDNFRAIGIGGDFFFFHPVDMAVGRYLYPDDVGKNGIVIDSYTAWRLFGSYDVLDMPVYIGNKAFYIRGVYTVDEGYMARKTGADGGFVYMDYDALKALGNVGSISCIEFAGDDVYEGNLYNILKDTSKLGLQENTFETVNNTSRFGIANLWKVFNSQTERVMRFNRIVYPYWENKARAYENILSTMLIVRAVLLITSIVLLIVFICVKYARRTWSIKTITDKLEDIAEEIRLKMQKENQGEEVSEDTQEQNM